MLLRQEHVATANGPCLTQPSYILLMLAREHGMFGKILVLRCIARKHLVAAIKLPYQLDRKIFPPASVPNFANRKLDDCSRNTSIQPIPYWDPCAKSSQSMSSAVFTAVDLVRACCDAEQAIGWNSARQDKAWQFCNNISVIELSSCQALGRLTSIAVCIAAYME